MRVFYLCLCLSHGFKNESKTDESYFVGAKCYIFPLWESFLSHDQEVKNCPAAIMYFPPLKNIAFTTKNVTFVMAFHASVETMIQTET